MQNDIKKTQRPDWLTLSEAADEIGVHPGTLRRWTDEGQIACTRTPGGHRRFSVEIIESFMNPKGEQKNNNSAPGTYINNLISQTQHEILVEQMETQSWYAAFNEDGRYSHRDSGRLLLGLILQYSLRTSGREQILEQAKKIGREYGCDAMKRGLSLVETVKAFFFFRETIIKTMRPGLTIRGRYDSEDIHIHRSLREILDQIFFAAMEGYENLMHEHDKKKEII